MIEEIDRAVEAIRKCCDVQPLVGVILGSGLGAFADTLEVAATIPFARIPHAAASGVAGHQGRLIIGLSDGVPVVALQGRIHYYEGYEMKEVVFLSRVIARLGVTTAIVTNAAGGVNTSFEAGDLMLISDHINMFGANPLRGANVDDLGVRFPDMNEVYSSSLRELARTVAGKEGITLREGIYLGLPGPSYETPAEIRAFRTLGADAVGMSTIPEVIVFAHAGIPVLGISCISNLAAGILPQKLTHNEVMETTAAVRERFRTLVSGVIRALPR
jgi:purine-nucleoside phosphorylase